MAEVAFAPTLRTLSSAMPMHWVGDGAKLWRVRVDLFVEDLAGRRFGELEDVLRSLMT